MTADELSASVRLTYAIDFFFACYSAGCPALDIYSFDLNDMRPTIAQKNYDRPTTPFRPATVPSRFGTCTMTKYDAAALPRSGAAIGEQMGGARQCPELFGAGRPGGAIEKSRLTGMRYPSPGISVRLIE